jgi:hypothetical protein
LSSNDEFARELFEDAKDCLHKARSTTDSVMRQRHLRHAILSAFSFLELQIDLVAQHFKASDFFSLHERGIINQREVSFERGSFKLKDAPRFSRLSDRMLLMQSKFKGSKLTARSWWDPLLYATERRNSVAHPRAVVTLELTDIESDLKAVISCANDLFEIVFGKGLPYATLGIKPKLAGK